MTTTDGEDDDDDEDEEDEVQNTKSEITGVRKVAAPQLAIPLFLNPGFVVGVAVWIPLDREMQSK